MREEYPVVYHEATEAWLISRYDDVERAFKDKTFTNKNYEWQLEPVHGRTILQMEGRDHSAHRNLIAPAFRGSELTAKFVPVIAANARDLIDGFRTDGKVDLVDQFSIRFPINVIVDMLGLDKSDH
ncbi:MAG: cytochrome P450, partial [bacterium]|nr:cytochrome P450 [bacterium]